jgi:hypothetical protein
MILGVVLPDFITPRDVGGLVRWLRERGDKLRPWLETFAIMTAAREGEEVPEGAVPKIFAAVMDGLDGLLAWPEMHAETVAAAHEWFAAHSAEGQP